MFWIRRRSVRVASVGPQRTSVSEVGAWLSHAGMITFAVVALTLSFFPPARAQETAQPVPAVEPAQSIAPDTIPADEPQAVQPTAPSGSPHVDAPNLAAPPSGSVPANAPTTSPVPPAASGAPESGAPSATEPRTPSTASPEAPPPAPDLTQPATAPAPETVEHTADPTVFATNAGHTGHSLDLSPWGMFMQADIVVKAVMIGLLLASVLTWTVWLAKSIELRVTKTRLRTQLLKLTAASSLSEAANLVDAKRGAVPSMIRAAIAETRASIGIADKNAIKERISARLERIELAAGRDINRGTGVLATVGATAPFVGLFGTVWGIMNSFIGISEAQTTNLAVVAPGIAEALLATAIGLVAAIPAVIMYNQFVRAIGDYKALVGDGSVSVLGLVSRDFDRGLHPELRPELRRVE